MNQPEQIKWYRCRRGPGLVASGPFLAAYIVSTALLRNYYRWAMPDWERFLIALIPLPFFGWLLWRFVALMRWSDELKRRIQLEALVIAFPLSVALLMTIALLQTAGFAVGGFSYLWMYLLIFYLIGRTVAERRYR